MHFAGDGFCMQFYMVIGRHSEKLSIKTKEMDVSEYLLYESVFSVLLEKHFIKSLGHCTAG